MIIGITGLKFSGKTTATDKLAKMLGYDVRSLLESDPPLSKNNSSDLLGRSLDISDRCVLLYL